MLAPVPAVPPVVALPPLSFSFSVVVLGRHALLGVRQLGALGLVRVEVGVDPHLRLVGAERAGEEAVEVRLERAVELRLERLLGGGAVAAGRPVALRPQELARAVGDGDVLGLEALDGGGDELGDALHGAGLQRVGRVGHHHGRGGRGRLVGEQVVLGQHELHLRALDAGDGVDGAGDLALERALVRDLLLHLGGAELLAVEQLPALVGAAGGARATRPRRRARPAPAAADAFSTASAVPLERSS